MSMAVNDVGRHVGWDMSDGWGAVIASVVAVLGTVLAGWLAYRAGRRQVKDQATEEHRAWRRQNRFDAYRNLMTMVDEFSAAADAWRLPTTRATAGVPRAMERVASAVAGVRLAGPDAMHAEANALMLAAGQLYQLIRGRGYSTLLPVAPRAWIAAVQQLQTAQDHFVKEAAKMLDDPSL